MALISLRNITHAFGGPPVLDSATLRIERRDRICLLGSNGAGKSTLLRILTGELLADGGTVARDSGVRVGMMPQAVPMGHAADVFSVVAADLNEHAPDEQRLVRTAISRVDLDPDAPFESLSGGRKRRVLLAAALVNEPDVLMLDEPTNHLDIDGVTWLEDFLRRYDGAVLFVTHDRTFLRKVAKRIVELDRGRLTRWDCSYDQYLQRKAELLDAEEKANSEFDRKLAQEEAWIRRGIKARRTRNEGRVRSLQAMREQRRLRRERQGSASMQMQQAQTSGSLVIEARDVSFGYDATPILQSLNLVVQRGDRIGIVGPNGSGKTTLLRLLLGSLAPTSGSVRHGVRLEVAYADQLRATLDDSATVLENVVGDGDFVEINGVKRHGIGYLKDFLFPAERARTPVSYLSGGERNRLVLAKLFTRPSNLLVFDEPTNDLDIQTLELLEELLADYQGTILAVSHDRSFLNNVVTNTLSLEPGGAVRECVGGYDDWLATRREATKKPDSTPAPKPRRRTGNARKLTYNETRELESLPLTIERLEAERDQAYARVAAPDAHERHEEVAALTARTEEIAAELERLYERWQELESIGE